MQDKLIRKLEFAPFFSEDSPWRRKIQPDDAPLPDSEIRAYATFEVLRQGSLLSIARSLAYGDISEDRFREFFRRYEQGGHLQIPAINFKEWTFPIFPALHVEGCEKVMSVTLKQYSGEDGYDNESVETIPVGGKMHALLHLETGPVRPSGPEDVDSDGALILFDESSCKAYDFWQATVRRPDGTPGGGGVTGNTILQAGSVTEHDMSGNASGAVKPSNKPALSGRASGLSYLGGLMIPEDLKRLFKDRECNPAQDSLGHALVFVLPSTTCLKARFGDVFTGYDHDWVYPAGNFEKSSPTVNPYALRSGQRIRLKRGTIYDTLCKPINDNCLKPITRIFPNTLRDFGAYLVDGGMGFAFAAEDVHTAPLRLEDAQVNLLVAAQQTAPLPEDRTAWHYVLEALQEDLYEHAIPFAARDYDESYHTGLPWALKTNFEVMGTP